MKDSGKINGGNFESKYISTCKSAQRDCKGTILSADCESDANYLFKALQAWNAKGFPAYAVGIQVRHLPSLCWCPK